MVASTIVVVAVPTPVGAASLTVNSVGDSPDVVPGNGVCETATLGECTLRAALQEANALAGADLIGFSIPGAGVHTIEPVTLLPMATEEVVIDGYTQPGSSANTLAVGTDAVLQIQISAASFDRSTLNIGVERFAGLRLGGGADGSVVRGLVVNGFDTDGTFGGFGIVTSATSTTIEGNFVGTEPTGTSVGAVNCYGVSVDVFADGTLVGGTTPAARNLIAGGCVGVHMTDFVGGAPSVVSGNLIGTNAAGDAPLRATYGVQTDGANAGSFVIGGTAPGSRNVISGNSAGVAIFSVGTDIEVLGNYIGTTADGLSALGAGGGAGVLITGGALTVTGVQIGNGTVAGRNVIAGNGNFAGAGIDLGAGAISTSIRGNSIGVNANGDPLPNANDGITVDGDAVDNIIGGTAPGEGNAIANNLGAGVRVIAGTGNRIVRNSIQDNGGPGILLGTGATNAANDLDDVDTGPNNLQNTPEIISADLAPDLQIAVSIDSAAASATAPIEIDFYEADSAISGEGRRYIGSATLPVTPGGQTLSLGALTGITAGDSIVATATDADGNTSPFSAPVSLPAYEVDSTGDAGDAAPGDDICETATPGECTLRAAIQESNAHAGPDAITFAIPGAGVQTITPLSPLPQLTDTVTIDGYTQPGASANTLAVGSDAVLLIEVSGQGNVGAFTNRIGLDVVADDVVVRGLVINGHDRPGFSPDTGASIRIFAGASRAVIEGNFLGTNAAGTAKATPTSIFGVNVFGDDAVIGGTAPAQRNVALGVLGGVSVENGGSATIIGNYLGTDKTGTVGLAGGGGSANGVSLSASATATVGGTTPGSGNLISGNDYGIQVNGAAAGFPKVVLGNFIGTNATGNAKPSGVNDIYGVFVGNFVSDGSVQIGDGTAQGRNVITGDRGITTLGPRIDVRGNSIGVGADGIAALPILASGVFLQGGSTSVVGGLGVGDGNVVANARYGVQLLLGAQRHTIVGNSMYANADNGIFMTVFGLVNDVGDPDAGANNLQNHPTVAPTIVGGDLVVDYTIDSTVVNSAYPIAIDVYIADALGRSGQVYLGRATAAGPGTGNANLGNLTGAVAGQTIVATATDANGNTSQFSTPVVIPGPVAPTISLDFDVAAGAPTTVDVARGGIRVTDLDRGALGGAGGAGSIASSSITTIGPEDTALATIRIADTPLRAVVLESAPLRAVPLVDIEVDTAGGGGWTELLTGTDLENVPLVNLTFGDALSEPTVSGRILALPLRAVEVDGTPLRAVPLAAIVLGSTPLRGVPLRAVAPGEPNAWCPVIEPVLVAPQTCEEALDQINLMEVALRGAPLRGVDLSSIPLRGVAVADSPLRGVPLRGVDIDASPLRGVPLRGVDLNASPLRGVPLRAVPLRGVPLRAVDLETVPLRGVTLESVPLRGVLVEGLSVDGTPLRGVPLRGVPLRGVDLETSPLRGVPLRGVPLRGVPLNAIELAQSPLRGVPLRGVDIVGSPLATIPLRGVDLQTSPLRGVPLRGVPLRGVPLRGVPIGALTIGGTPLRGVPLRGVDILSSPLRGVPLRGVTVPGAINCALVDCVKGTLGDALLAGAIPTTTTLGDIIDATSGIRLSDVGPYFTDFTESQLAAALANSTLTFGDLVTLDDMVLGDLPLAGADFAALVLGDLGNALSRATLGDLVGSQNPAGGVFTESQLQTILDGWDVTIGELADADAGNLTMGDVFDASTVDVFLSDLGSLLDHLNVGQLVTIVPGLQAQVLAMTETLGDLTPEQLGRMTLGDLGDAAGDVTIGELLAGLGGLLDDYTLGDLLLALVDPGSLAYGGVEFDSFDERSLPPGSIGATTFDASFTLTAAADQNVTVEVALPSQATYVAGSSLIDGTTAPDPVQVGGTLVWSLVADNAAAAVDIRFDVLPALRLGSTSLTATASIVGTGVSATATASVTVAEGSEPNDFAESAGPGSPRQTTAAAEDVVYLTYIPTATDIDVFEIDLAENDRLVVQLSNLDADLDVVLWARPADAAAAAALGPVSDESPLRPLVDPDADGVDATPLDDFVRLDTLDSSLRLVATSNQSGNADEVISTDRLPAGTYFVQVVGANGATNVAPASLQLKVREGDAPPPCRAIDPLPTANAVPNVPTIPGSANTLILVNQSRIEQIHGATDRAAVTAATTRLTSYLAANPQLGVSPVVVPVDAYPAVRAAYAAWDGPAGSCDPDAANAVVAAINREIIDPRRAQFEHIVFLGGDELIPMARLHDGTLVANEYDFRDEFDGDLAGGPGSARNAATASFWESMILSDEPYGDTAARSTGHGYLYVSDTALGRVVETPDEIVDALDTFVSFGGNLSIETATVLGYDFLTDGSVAVADDLAAAGLPVDRDLQSGVNLGGTAWDAADATTELAQAGTRALISLNAHFDHYRALPAVGDKVPGFDDNLIATEVASTLGPEALAQSLVFSMGCHSGFSVSDVLVGTTNADWAQTLSQQEALFVGNTGFGYGDTETVAYTEELMRLFADRVTSPFALPLGPSTSSSTVGQALTWAKNDFVAGLQSFSVYDEKAVMESTFYGLPFYRVGLTPEALPPAPSRTAAPDGTGTSTSRVEVVSTNATVVTPSGSYPANTSLSGDELVIVAPGRPIQPKLVEDVSVVAPGDSTALAQVAHGAIVEDMTSIYTGIADPVIATPVFDASASRPEPDAGDVAFPTEPVEITTTTGPSGERQQLVLATGQYRSDTGVQRLDSDIDVVVYYAAPSESDFTAPTIGAVDAQLVGGRLAISTTVADASSDVDRVYVIVVENPGFGPAEWTGVDLVRSGSTDRWTGSLVLAPTTTDVEFMVQAKDGAGNVGVATNKARNFDVDQPVAPPAPPADVLTASPTAAPGTSGVYGAPVEIAVDANATATFSVDGGAPAPVPTSGRFTIAGDGFHTWQVEVPSGHSVTGTVLIDTAAPVVTLDRAAGPARTGTAVTLTAGDAGAGVASITYSASGAISIPPTTVSGASVTVPLAASGETTITVVATDTVGNVSAATTSTYLVDGAAPVVTGTLSSPPNGAGWHRQPVQVVWSTDDPGATTPPPVTVTTEGDDQVITSAPSCDAAGNCATGSVTVNLDLSAPAATIDTDEPANGADWNNTPVTVRVTCGVDLSGVVCPDPLVVATDGAGQTVSVSVVDAADNVTSLVSRVINIDRVAPTVTWTAPANGAVVLQSAYARPTCQVSDALSGTDGVCTVDIPEPDMTTPGRSIYTATAVGSDKAGNTTTLTTTYTVLTDEDGPMVDVTAAPPANPAGWWNTPVTYSFLCNDPTGVASCPAPRTLTAQGANQSFSVTATDQNGNSTPVIVSAINIDLAPPTLTVNAPTSVGPLDTVTIACAAVDVLSGIANESCEDQTFAASTLAPGVNTFTFTATDIAGNVATTARTITLAIPTNDAPTVRADMGVTGLNEIGFQTNIVVINGSFSDPAGPGPYTASVRWAAGGAFTPLALNNGSEFVAAFIYGSAGTRTVTVRICDAGGACGTDDLVVRTRVTQRITPVRQCVVDRGAGTSPRYQARWGYDNPAAFAIAVPSIPILENTFTSTPFLRGQPQILLPGAQRGVFTTTFASGTSTWRINGNSASATSTSPRC